MTASKNSMTRHGVVSDGDLFVFKTNIDLYKLHLQSNEEDRVASVEKLLGYGAQDGQVCHFFWENKELEWQYHYYVYADEDRTIELWCGTAGSDSCAISYCFERYGAAQELVRKQKVKKEDRSW
jgi:hypothetical protein